MYIDIKEATKKLERYCAYRERCHKEVVEKLRGMGMVAVAIDHIVTHLITENYLNEERFARSFARGKFRIKKWGKNRIISELRYRNISEYNVRAAMEELPELEYQGTLDALAKKYLSTCGETQLQIKKRKLANYLLYRGWESSLVNEKIRQLL